MSEAVCCPVSRRDVVLITRYASHEPTAVSWVRLASVAPRTLIAVMVREQRAHVFNRTVTSETRTCRCHGRVATAARWQQRNGPQRPCSNTSRKPSSSRRSLITGVDAPLRRCRHLSYRRADCRSDGDNRWPRRNSASAEAAARLSIRRCSHSSIEDEGWLGRVPIILRSCCQSAIAARAVASWRRRSDCDCEVDDILRFTDR